MSISISKNRAGWVDEASVLSQFNFGKSSPGAISFYLPKSLEGHCGFFRLTAFCDNFKPCLSIHSPCFALLQTVVSKAWTKGFTFNSTFCNNAICGFFRLTAFCDNFKPCLSIHSPCFALLQTVVSKAWTKGFTFNSTFCNNAICGFFRLTAFCDNFKPCLSIHSPCFALLQTVVSKASIDYILGCSGAHD